MAGPLISVLKTELRSSHSLEEQLVLTDELFLLPDSFHICLFVFFFFFFKTDRVDRQMFWWPCNSCA